MKCCRLSVFGYVSAEDSSDPEPGVTALMTGFIHFYSTSSSRAESCMLNVPSRFVFLAHGVKEENYLHRLFALVAPQGRTRVFIPLTGTGSC